MLGADSCVGGTWECYFQLLMLDLNMTKTTTWQPTCPSTTTQAFHTCCPPTPTYLLTHKHTKTTQRQPSTHLALEVPGVPQFAHELTKPCHQQAVNTLVVGRHQEEVPARAQADTLNLGNAASSASDMLGDIASSWRLSERQCFDVCLLRS